MELSKNLIEINCPICNSKESTHKFRTRDYLFRVTNDEFGVRCCDNCGCGFLSPRPISMREYYPADFYWAWEGSNKELKWDEIILKRKRQLDAKASWLSDLKPGRLLDIGAQKGEFLWYMKQRGWIVEGVELDSEVPNPALMDIRYGDFLSMEISSEKYDVITFWAVLEHVDNPNAFIKKASSLLKPGGRLIVVVTNFNSIQSFLFQADDYPRHLTIFTKKSALLIAKNNNFAIEKFSTDQKIFGGPLNGGLVYFIKRIFGYSKDDLMSEWKQMEDPDLFWCKWRGANSGGIKMISRIDSIISRFLEPILDRLGFGLTLTFIARKS